jgi:hypothetical protein
MVVLATVTVLCAAPTVLTLVTVLTEMAVLRAVLDGLTVTVLLAIVTVFWPDPTALKVTVLNMVVGEAFWF